MQLWLESQHVAGLSSSEVLAYITTDWGLLRIDDGCATKLLADDPATDAAFALYELTRQKATAADVVEGAHISVNTKALKLLNLVNEWLKIYLPHVLQKVHASPARASYWRSTAQQRSCVMTTTTVDGRARRSIVSPSAFCPAANTHACSRSSRTCLAHVSSWQSLSWARMSQHRRPSSLILM